MHAAHIDHVVIMVTIPELSDSLLRALGDYRFPVTVLDARTADHPGARITMIAGMGQARLPLFFQLVRQHEGAVDEHDPADPGSAEVRIADGTRLTRYPRLTGCIETEHVIEVRIGGATSYVVPVHEYLEI